MLRKPRDTARAGHKGCYCCYPPADNATLRKREERAWLEEIEDEGEEGE